MQSICFTGVFVNSVSLNNVFSLSKRIFASIEDDILSGKYISGEKISESKLANELGVSRTPVREALNQLANEGLVELVPNRGALVKGISNDDIKEIYEIRAVIEGLAAKWATENITEQEISELKDSIDLEEFYTNKGELGNLMMIDSSFHEGIYRASKSRPMMYMLKTFHQYVRKARNMSLSVPGRAKKAFDEHTAILSAIIKGEGNRASELTTKHVRNAKKNLVKALEQKSAKVNLMNR